MYIAIYITVIVMFSLGIILFFVFKNRKDKKHLNSLSKPKIEEVEKLPENSDTSQIMPKEKEIEPQISPEAVFEDYSWEEKSENKEMQKDNGLNNRRFGNPFKRDIFNDFDDDTKDDEEDEDFLNNKFSEYEKFLKKAFKDEGDEKKGATSLADFDFSSLQGKSLEEIIELTKDYPKEIQDAILDKKSFDEKED